VSERLMAMVATKAPAVSAPKAVARALRNYLSKKFDNDLQVVEGDPEDNAGFVVATAGVSVAVVAFPFPIPVETLGTAIGGELIWNEAGDVFLASKGHFLISIMNPDNDPRERLNHARVLSMVTAAVLTASKGTAIFWQASDSVIEPKRFLKEVKGVGDDLFASALWFGFRFYPGSNDPESDLIVCQSRGLEAFLGREVECGPYAMTPAEMAETVILVARFMATSGPVFADGHTLGISGTEEADARIFFDWSSLGGVNRAIFQLRLKAQEKDWVDG
jgi:hypothetical protein